jgi:hypothetical protein
VSPLQVSEFWPYVEPLLKAAAEHCGQWNISELRHQLDKGALLWLAFDGAVKAACITRLLMESNGKVLEALACGGEGQDWRRLYEEIEDYGRNEGCVLSRVSGREGWKRVFKDYDLKWIVLEKRLDA